MLVFSFSFNVLINNSNNIWMKAERYLNKLILSDILSEFSIKQKIKVSSLLTYSSSEFIPALLKIILCNSVKYSSRLKFFISIFFFKLYVSKDFKVS